MKFTTKKYTRPLLVSEIKGLNNKSFATPEALASALSPRSGTKSAKFAALTKYVGGRKAMLGAFRYNNARKFLLSKLN